MTDHITTFNLFIDSNLNQEQKKAVAAKNGIFLVIAGAGSGKTRVITARIAHLIINRQTEPSSIIALTFTNKAAKEMKERIIQFLPPGHPLPFIGTFHSYCLRLLKANNDLLETPFVSILDEDDRLKLLGDIIKRNGLQKRITAKKSAYSISRFKNNTAGKLKSSGEYLFSMPFMKEIFTAYEKEKAISKCLDFDDLLVHTVRLFDNNKQFKKTFQQALDHILIDEYQDTNVVQHTLLKHLALNEKKSFAAQSLCVVGDEDQSIYSWRGATVANIVNFKKDFPATKIIKIEQNYRSVQPILTIANHLIKNNVKRNPKKLWTEKKAHDRIRAITCLSEYQEGDVVAQFLKTADEKQSLSSIAIVYRAHYQTRAIEEALVRNTIPYTIIGGIQFYERKEIKDILAYLRLILNPFDRASFFRIINCPTRGLGAKFEELFYQHWNQEVLFNFKDVGEKLIETDLLTQIKKESLKTFLNIFSPLDAHTKPSAAIERIISACAFMTHLKNTHEQKDAESRIENVKELLSAVRYLEKQGTETIAQFLDEVALMREKVSKDDEKKEKNAVILMTLHAAKGLEFDTVIIIGLEDGLLPSSRSLIDPDAVEEERRLFYVGITRAKERLLLTHAKYRYTYGQMASQPPSRFLKELPDKHFIHHDCSHDRTHQIDTLFANWLGIKERTTTQSEVFTFGLARKEKPIQKKTMHTTKIVGRAWRKNQPVQHTKFGIGIVQKVEKKSAEKIYLTVKFKTGTKKLDSKFVIKV